MCSMIAELPQIDLRELDQPGVRDTLDRACREWGVFMLTGHGIDTTTSQALLEQAKTFFTGPQEIKDRIRRTELNPWGYYDNELTKNTRDWKEVFDYGPGDSADQFPQWPAEVPGLKLCLLAFYEECERISRKLLSVMSNNLGLPSDFLAPAFMTSHTSFTRLNYYPPCPSQGHLGVNPHTDSGAFTLLLQDHHAALQVLHRGQWHLVAPQRGALAVNLGDIFQVWSNDRYQAAVHRVLTATESSRLSVPFFFNPSNDTVYAPLEAAAEPRPARYRPINWGEFRRQRAQGDFADYGAEVQISDYRT